MSLRNTRELVSTAHENYRRAIDFGLMQQTATTRQGKRLTLPDGSELVEFVSCSYLGIDARPEVIAAGHHVIDNFGVHLCCARSRFSIAPLMELEEQLSALWGGRAITFPSVTTAHMSCMPLLIDRIFDSRGRPGVFLFDRLAHASMQFLRPILAEEHQVEMLPHNDVQALEDALKRVTAAGAFPVYVADTVYSMGGACPLESILPLCERFGTGVYLDDAHGTSIFGAKGEGFALQGRKMNPNLVISFSLSKGFGCNGGGVLLPSRDAELAVRTFGTTYAFSAPLDFGATGSALAAAELHRNGTLGELQAALRKNVQIFDALRPMAAGTKPEAPIRMVPVGDETRAIDMANALKKLGFFVSVVFFPIVARGNAQLRICLTSAHTEQQVRGLCTAIAGVA